MGSRLELHAELLKVVPKEYKAYFQPPATVKMVYPCIVYNKTGKEKKLANDGIYLKVQEYQIMVIEVNPDSNTADTLEEYFQHCSINQYYTVDNLNHTTLTLYY